MNGRGSTHVNVVLGLSAAGFVLSPAIKGGQGSRSVQMGGERATRTARLVAGGVSKREVVASNLVIHADHGLVTDTGNNRWAGYGAVVSEEPEDRGRVEDGRTCVRKGKKWLSI